MTTITTETGYCVLVDSDGTVVAKCDIPPGEHPVGDSVYPAASFDVDSADELDGFVAGEAVPQDT
jgi:hypothetical protein